MTIVTAASRTSRSYPLGELSADRLFAAINSHNELVEDVHDFTALMDGDTGLTDTDYEAALTAAQIDHSGYTPTEATPAPVQGLFGEFPVGVVSEEIAKAFTAELGKAVDDIDAIITKLNADGTVTATNFDTSRYRATRLIQRATIVENQDSVASFLMLTDRWHYGELLAAGLADTGTDTVILRSTDDGRSWHHLFTFPTAVRAVVKLVQTQRSNRLLAFCTLAADLALYESLDFGRSWTDVSSRLPTLTSTAFTDALVVPTSGVILASAGAAGEIVRSVDAGLTFTEVVVTGPTAVNSLGYSPTTGKVFACGDDAILYSSTDDGAVFAEEEDFSGGNPDDCLRFLELANGFWLVTTHVGAGTDELQVSQDAGATWETPVAVTDAQDELGLMVQGPDGIVYLQVGANIQVSDDNGATVEVAGAGIDLPAADTAVTAFGKNRRGEVLSGTVNATGFGGIFLVGIRDNQLIDAFAEESTEFGPLGPQHGAGASGGWLDYMVDQQTLLVERWQALGAMMDADGDVDETTYEAAIAELILTPSRREASRDLHNAGHGAVA